MFKSGEWKEYNDKLVKRGEVLIDLGFLKNEMQELGKMNENKIGRPYQYSESLFKFLGYLYAFVRNYRIIEGLCRALRKIIPNFPTPDHSTIQRRLRYEFENKKIAGNMLIVDSTGFRMGRATEYVEYRHRLRRSKRWVKLHIITDGKKIVRFIITKNNVGDSPAFREMFKTLKKELENVDVVIADTAYDSRENFNLIANSGIKPLIKVRKNSSTLSKRAPSRRMAVIKQRDPLWCKKSGYSKRWLVESVFSSIKRLFGETLSSRNFIYALRELAILVSLFNLFHSL